MPSSITDATSSVAASATSSRGRGPHPTTPSTNRRVGRFSGGNTSAPRRRSPRHNFCSPPPDPDGQDDQELSQPLLSPIDEIEINVDSHINESQLTTDGFSPGESGKGITDEQQQDGDSETRYFGGEDGEDEDEYAITDYTASQYDINMRVSHFMGCVPISLNNRVTVEAAYMVEAVTLVKSMRTMKKPEIAAAAQDKYTAFIGALPLSCFADASVKVRMAEKYSHAKSNSPEGFLTKATDVLKNVRVVAAGIKGIGTPLHQIPSGKSITNMKNQFILKNYMASQGVEYVPSNDDDKLLGQISEGWWMQHASTNLLLAVLVHRTTQTSPLIPLLFHLEQLASLFVIALTARLQLGEKEIVLWRTMVLYISVRSNL